MRLSSLCDRSVRSMGRGQAASRSLFIGLAGTLLFSMSPVRAFTNHVKVSTESTKRLGTYLVSGRTLYQHNTKDCTSALCHKVWPPPLSPKRVTKATAGPVVNAAKLGTTKLANGARRVTYGRRAFYWFFQDTAPARSLATTSEISGVRGRSTQP